MRRHVVLACLAAIAFACVCALVVPVSHRVGVDMTVATWIAAHRSASLIGAAKAASLAGSVLGIVPLALLIAWYLQRRDGWHAVRWYAIAIVGATIAYLAFTCSIAIDRRWGCGSWRTRGGRSRRGTPPRRSCSGA